MISPKTMGRTRVKGKRKVSPKLLLTIKIFSPNRERKEKKKIGLFERNRDGKKPPSTRKVSSEWSSLK